MTFSESDRVGRVIAYGAMHQYHKALTDLNQSVRLDKLDSIAYEFRARTDTSLGMEAEAEKDVKRSEEMVEDASRLRD